MDQIVWNGHNIFSSLSLINTVTTTSKPETRWKRRRMNSVKSLRCDQFDGDKKPEDTSIKMCNGLVIN